MDKSIVRFIKHPEIRIVAGSLIVLFLVLYPAINYIANQLAEQHITTQVSRVEDGVRQDLAHSLDQAREIASLTNVSRFISLKDRQNLIPVLTDEVQKRDLSLAVAVDENGVVLARIPTVGSFGDYIFETQPWGRDAAAGESSALIGEGRTYPLVMIGSYPLKSGDKINGAVFAGFRFDDAYASRFVGKYLDNSAEVVFYSKQDGVISDSFKDRSTKPLLANFFSNGSDWIQKGKTDAALKIGNTIYILKNIIFPDPEKFRQGSGGMLVLIPYNVYYQNIVIAIIVTLFFLLAVIHFYRKHRFKIFATKRKAWALIISSALATFFVVLFLGTAGTVQPIPEIKQIPYTIYNSTLRFKPDSNVVDESAEQRIAIELNTSGESINAINTVVNFDPLLARVDDVITTNSVCKPELFLERLIDNKNGVVKLTCGIPTPGFANEKGIVAELLVQPLQTGTFRLKFATGTQVLANDGLGTNVLREAIGGSYEVRSAKDDQAASAGVFPRIAVFSPSHSNSERWYNSKRIRIVWPYYEKFQYVYALDQNPRTTPRLAQYTNKNAIDMSVFKDGIYYFHIAAVKDNKIGPVTHFKIQIDATPPLPPVIKTSATVIKPGDIVRFQFSGTDELSGLQPNFYINIDDSVRFPTLSQLYVPFFDEGVHSVRLRVFDNAGNFTDSVVQIIVQQ